MSKKKWLFLAFLAALQIADVVTTNHALANPAVSEANPFMVWCMCNLGSIWWLPKLGFIGFALLAGPRLPDRAFTMATAFYVVLVTNNVFQF